MIIKAFYRPSPSKIRSLGAASRSPHALIGVRKSFVIIENGLK